VVFVGESLTLPEGWDVEGSVRVELPAVAVIVTAVAFVVCQLRVTLCPALIELTLAEKTRVGAVLGPPARPPQALSPHKANGSIPLVMKRTLCLFICLRRFFPVYTRRKSDAIQRCSSWFN
jgi:hypothetical protein